MHTNDLRKLARETNDGVLRGPALGAADEIDRLRAEIERLKTDRETAIHNARHYTSLCDKAEAERDEARAQVAAAYEAAAKYLQSAADDWRSTYNELPAKKIEDEIPGVLELTPADAKSALEAYGRKKVREGMRMAADLFPTGSRDGATIRDAILAEMEALK